MLQVGDNYFAGTFPVKALAQGPADTIAPTRDNDDPVAQFH
jgi:hypothetical protein